MQLEGIDDREFLRSLHQYRLLADRSPDVLSRHDAETTFHYVSPAIRTVLGWEPAEVLGRTLADFLHPDDGAALERERGALRAGDDETRHVYRMRHRLGHYLWMESTNTIVSDVHEGDDVEVVSSRRDVTERLAMEGLVRESEQRFRIAFEDAPIGMSLVAPDGHWLRVNDALCKIVGYSRSELLKRSFRDVTHPDDLEGDLELMRSMLAGDRGWYETEKRYVRADGRVVWVQVSVSLARTTDDEPLYFISRIQDVSERRAAQELLATERHALERSNLELERFASVVSHDLQASLRTVSGFAELLGQRLEGQIDESAQRDLLRIVQGTQRMQSLLDGIRAYSRVQLGDPHREEISGDTVLAEVEQSLARDLAAAGAALEVESLGTLFGDPVQMHELFENIIGNALKFRREDVPLRVRVSASHDDGGVT